MDLVDAEGKSALHEAAISANILQVRKFKI